MTVLFGIFLSCIMSSTVSFVLRCKFLPDTHLARICSQALSTETVNKEITSNDDIVSSSSIVMSVILSLESVELVTE